MYSYNPYYYEYLAHHGVKGQKWGVRRYQPYTSANKGVFKNLKRSYKSSVRSLKKAKRQYESEGDKLAVKGTEKAIKEAKKIYKSELKGLKKDFRAENRANYLQDVAERGSEKQVAEVRKEMSPDQLDYAVRRINTYKNWEKLSMRDVEAEVKQEQAMKRLDHIMKGAETVSKVATSATQVIGTVKAFKDLFPKPKSEYEKEKQKLELEGMKNKNDLAKAQAEKMRNEIKNNSKNSETQVENKDSNVKTGEYKDSSKPRIASIQNTPKVKTATGLNGYRDFLKDKYGVNDSTTNTKIASIQNTPKVKSGKLSESTDHFIKRMDKEIDQYIKRNERSIEAKKILYTTSDKSDAARHARFITAREIVNNPNDYTISTVNRAQREVVDYIDWERKNKK